MRQQQSNLKKPQKQQKRRRKEKTKEQRRDHALKHKYGIVFADYVEMAYKQGNECAICGMNGKDTGKGKLYIDHCHRTGRIRQLLCHHCNTSIGLINDDYKWAFRSAFYLTKFHVKHKCLGFLQRSYYHLVQLSWAWSVAWWRMRKRQKQTSIR